MSINYPKKVTGTLSAELITTGIQSHSKALVDNQIAAIGLMLYANASGREATICEEATRHVHGLVGGRGDLLAGFYETFLGLSRVVGESHFSKFAGVAFLSEPITVRVNEVDKYFPNKIAAAKEYMFWTKAAKDVFKVEDINDKIRSIFKSIAKKQKVYDSLVESGNTPEGEMVSALTPETMQFVLNQCKLENLVLESNVVSIIPIEELKGDEFVDAEGLKAAIAH
jgi:hypothetical protein